MKFEKVIFIRYYPLTKAIYTDLYLEDLINNNIEVNYLDVTNLFYPERVKAEPFEFSGTVKIDSYKQLKDYLLKQNNKKTLYISIMTFEWTVFKLFRLFTKLDLTLGVFARGVFPNAPIDKKSEITRIFKVLSINRIKIFIANKYTYLSKKIRYIKPYDYIFQAGEYGYYGLGLGCEIDFKKATIVDVNTVDYDQFLIHAAEPSKNQDENIVFLDQYLPYHPDAVFSNIPTVDPDKYYKELNAFFDKLELATGKKIIIAGHPKAELYKKFNPFNGREIFINKSNDLVKKYSLILTHASTAICFPICYNKRIILLVSDYLNDVLPQFYTTAKAIVHASDAVLIAMDSKSPLHIPESINAEKYTDFKYKYLTSKKTEDHLSRNIFLKFLINS